MFDDGKQHEILRSNQPVETTVLKGYMKTFKILLEMFSSPIIVNIKYNTNTEESQAAANWKLIKRMSLMKNNDLFTHKP